MENLIRDLITTGQAARLLGAKRITVTHMCQRGALTAVKLANRWMLRRSEVEELAKTYVAMPGPRGKRSPKIGRNRV